MEAGGGGDKQYRMWEEAPPVQCVQIAWHPVRMQYADQRQHSSLAGRLKEWRTLALGGIHQAAERLREWRAGREEGRHGG